jgi:hypothetical protein
MIAKAVDEGRTLRSDEGRKSFSSFVHRLSCIG